MHCSLSRQRCVAHLRLGRLFESQHTHYREDVLFSCSSRWHDSGDSEQGARADSAGCRVTGNSVQDMGTGAGGGLLITGGQSATVTASNFSRNSGVSGGGTFIVSLRLLRSPPCEPPACWEA